MRPPTETMREIAVRVAAQHKLTLEELTGPIRKKRVSHPRQQAMVEMRQTGRYSTTQIGRFFGDRDHTTVIHATRAFAARAEAAL